MDTDHDILADVIYYLRCSVATEDSHFEEEHVFYCDEVADMAHFVTSVLGHALPPHASNSEAHIEVGLSAHLEEDHFSFNTVLPSLPYDEFEDAYDTGDDHRLCAAFLALAVERVPVLYAVVSAAVLNFVRTINEACGSEKN